MRFPFPAWSLVLASLWAEAAPPASSTSGLEGAPQAEPRQPPVAAEAPVPAAVAAVAPLPPASQVIDRLNDLFRADSSEARLTMKVVTARYDRELVLQSWTRGKKEALVVVRGPAREAGTATLRSAEGLWSYAPRADRLVRIPSTLLSDSWMGSHFTNDDLMRETDFSLDYDATLEWKGQGGKRLLQATLKPKPQAPVVWTRVVYLLDPQDFLPLRADYYDGDADRPYPHLRRCARGERAPRAFHAPNGACRQPVRIHAHRVQRGQVQRDRRPWSLHAARAALGGQAVIRLALRNLTRNSWRSALTVSGVAIAVAALAWSQTMTEAFLDTMIRSAAAVQMGDLRVESEAHAKEGSMYDGFPATDGLLERVRRVPGVRAAAPRLSSYGLLGHEARSQAAMLIGVAPEAEAVASDVAQSVVAGAWLSTGDTGDTGDTGGQGGREIVLGEPLARLLSAKVGDELVAMVQAADGSTGDDRLRVVGLARTGSSGLDRGAAWMRIADVGWLAALDGQAHELIVRAERGTRLDGVKEALQAAVGGADGPKLVVRTWEELLPDLRQLVEITRLTMLVLYGIVCFVAALGILNAQRMTALERKREFAVMMAVGVTPVRLASLVVLEAALLTGLGVVVGGLLGWGLSAWHAHAGLDLVALGSQGFSYGGADIASRIYCVVRPMLIIVPALAVLAGGVLCGLWPALVSARLELVRAISGRT